jgi:hypothetical protein
MAEPKAALIEGQVVIALGRVPLGPTPSGDSYSERWLQEMLQRSPTLLPIDEIEPGFGRLLPVSMEVPCSSGMIDNLFVTTDGGIALVETKLWRSPEARRAVVAQVLDYVAAVSRMTYSDFEAAALAGEFLDSDQKPTSLYSIVAEDPEAPSEAVFIDAISSNLRRGRLLAIAAGDGIRSESEALAELLQSHAGARFTFALAAIELFALDDNRVFAIPRTVAKTVLIERGVVRVDDARIVVEPAPVKPDRSGSGRITMTEELLFEKMAALNPALPSHLRAFIDRIAALGIEPVWKASLNLKWSGWPDGPVNLGYIPKDGRLGTDAVNWMVGPERALSYLEEVAALIGGKVRGEGSPACVVSADGKTPRIDALLPQHAEAWASAMERFIDRLRIGAESEA